MKALYTNIIEYIKKNHISLVMILLFVAFGAIQLSQNIAIGAIYKYTSNNTEKIEQNKVLAKSTLNRRTEQIYGSMAKYNKESIKRLNELDTKLNSRIDIVASGMDHDNKRRKMIEAIRQAIKENTYTKLSTLDLNRIANAVIDYSYEYDLSIVYILAQIKQESDFKIKVRSDAGAKGLMQIMPHTMQYIEAKMSKPLNSWNIYNNIRAGCYYMAEQKDEFGTYEDAWRAYNWGPDNLRRYNAKEIKIMPEETKKYPEYIKKWASIFAKYGLEGNEFYKRSKDQD